MSLAKKFLKQTKLKGSGLLSKTFETPETFYDTGIPALNLAYSGSLVGSEAGLSYGVSLIAGKSKSFKCLGYDTNLEIYLSEEDYEKIKDKV